MPAGDGTGPQGMGPMTGRAAGFCGGYNAPGYANTGRGGGFGRGFGRGRCFGFRNRPFGAGAGWAQPVYAPQAVSQEDELTMLKQQADSMKSGLEQIQQRIDALETNK